MPNSIRVKAARAVGSTKVPRFQHPITGQWVSGVLGSDGLFATEHLNVPAGTYNHHVADLPTTGLTALSTKAVVVIDSAPPDSALTGLVFTSGPDTLAEGASGTYGFAATYANGATHQVSNATLNSPGAGYLVSGNTLTVQGNNAVGDNRSINLTATYQGQTATKAISILDSTGYTVELNNGQAVDGVGVKYWQFNLVLFSTNPPTVDQKPTYTTTFNGVSNTANLLTYPANKPAVVFEGIQYERGPEDRWYTFALQPSPDNSYQLGSPSSATMLVPHL